jgi:hypothetical protein
MTTIMVTYIVDVKMSIVVHPTPKTTSCHAKSINSTTSNANHLILNALHHQNTLATKLISHLLHATWILNG